jgi:hypothetical protein
MTNLLQTTITSYVDVLHGLATPGTLNAFRSLWNDTPLIYAIRNDINGRLYIGAT